MQAIYNLTNPHAANGQSYYDVYLGNGRTIYFDYSGAAITSATINSVRLVWYGNVLGGAGNSTLTMHGGTMTIPLTATGETRQECAVVATGVDASCFGAASGTLELAIVLSAGSVRFQWARLEVDYTPNASKLTLSQTSANAGQTLTATVTPYIEGCTHSLGLYFGTQEKWWTMDSGTTSQEISVPIAWLDQMTTSAVGTATVRLFTLVDGNILGSDNASLTVTAGADSAPTFTAVCKPLYTIDGETYPDVTGGYVQGKSGVTATMSGVSAQYGASIVSTSISVMTYGVTGTGDLTLNSGLINQAGSIDVVFAATDSRGVTATQTVNLTVEAYTPPRLGSLSVNRCDADGTADPMGEYGGYSCTWSGTDLGGKNALVASWSVRQKGTTDTPVQMVSDASSGAAGVLSDSSGAYVLSQAHAWEIILTIADSYTAVSFTGVIGSAQFVRTVNRKLNAVAYGKTAEHQDSFEVADSLEMYVHGQTLKSYITAQQVTPTLTKKHYGGAYFSPTASTYTTLSNLTVDATGLYAVCWNVRMVNSLTGRSFAEFGRGRVSFPTSVEYPAVQVLDVLEMEAGTEYPLKFWSETGGMLQYEAIELIMVKMG